MTKYDKSGNVKVTKKDQIGIRMGLCRVKSAVCKECGNKTNIIYDQPWDLDSHEIFMKCDCTKFKYE